MKPSEYSACVAEILHENALMCISVVQAVSHRAAEDDTGFYTAASVGWLQMAAMSAAAAEPEAAA